MKEDRMLHRVGPSAKQDDQFNIRLRDTLKSELDRTHARLQRHRANSKHQAQVNRNLLMSLVP